MENGKLRRILKNKMSYYLTDMEEEVYDPRAFKTFREACRINMMIQIATDKELIVPMKMSFIIKNKYKKKKLF